MSFYFENIPVHSDIRLSVPVVYEQPSCDELKSRFGLVDENFEGRRFEAVDSCKDAKRGNQELAFELIFFRYITPNCFAVSAMEREGLRPALYEELLSFSLANPYRFGYSIFAIGSEAVVRRYPHVACFFDAEDGNRALGMRWNGREWLRMHAHLAVRISSPRYIR